MLLYNRPIYIYFNLIIINYLININYKSNDSKYINLITLKYLDLVIQKYINLIIQKYINLVIQK